MIRVKAKIRDKTGRQHVGKTTGQVVASLNRHGNSAKKFCAVDSYVHERLALLTSRKHGRRGRNWATRYPYRWYRSLGVHRLSGTVRYRAAHA